MTVRQMYDALLSLMQNNDEASDMEVLIADTEGTDKKYIIMGLSIESITSSIGEVNDVLVIR